MTLSMPQAMACFAPTLPLVVAYSGGADSTALLLACSRQWPGQVRALHVHHGLQAAADDFEQHCRAVCNRLAVPLTVLAVDARHRPGQSPEDAARRARYRAFESFVAGDGSAVRSIALAQHADDQVETVLLALSRGAGLPGLSGMAADWTHGGVLYHRPLLQVAGAEIRRWLTEQDVCWIEDPSNADERFTRNRIRLRVLPALQTCFPQFRDTFARSAAHAAQAQALLLELAAQDLAQVGSPPEIRKLQTLSSARLANVLRHWLQSAHQASPSAAQLDALMRQIAACTTRGHRLHLKVANGFCTRRAGVLDWYNPAVSTSSQSP